MTPRLLIAVAALAGLAACASAPRVHSFAELPRVLSEGREVRVTEPAGAVTTGRVREVAAQSLSVQAGAAVVAFEPARVARIDRRERRVGTGVLLGAGLGLVIGLVSARTSAPSDNPYLDTVGGAASMAGGAVLGAVLGGVTGIFWKPFRTVYSSPHATPAASDGSPARGDGGAALFVAAAAVPAAVPGALAAPRPR